MAKKRIKPVIAVSDPKPTFVKVTVEPSEDTPIYYINHVEVSHNAHDFNVSVTRMAAKLTARQHGDIKSSGELVVEPILQLVMPPTLIPGLIAALQSQQKLYELNYGNISNLEEKLQREK